MEHEIILPNNDLTFKLFKFEGQAGNYIREKHWHRSVEIFALTAGDLDFRLKEADCHLQAGEFIIINSNEVHSVASPHRNDTIVLQIPLSTFAAYFTEDKFIRFSHAPNPCDSAVMALMAEIYDRYREQAPGYEFLVQSRYYELLYLLVTAYRQTSPEGADVRKNKRLNRLRVITDYIRDNYQEELPLAETASRFGYSPTHLSHMFKQDVGINYKAYVQSIRVEYATEELLKTEHTIAEIALNHGFANSKAFTKFFRDKHGLAPSLYRKENRKFLP